MSSRKDFSEEEIKKIGLRIKACRVLTGFNQEEFANKYNIPVPSLKAWEYGSAIPRIDNLNRFIDCLKNDGLYLNSDWIYHGYGIGPSYQIEQPSFARVNNDEDEDDSFKLFFEKFSKKNKKNPVIFTVNDDEMEPLFSKGDLIAGNLLNLDDMVIPEGKPIIVISDANKYLVRYAHTYEGNILSRSIKNLDLKKISSQILGLIRWHNHANK